MATQRSGSAEPSLEESLLAIGSKIALRPEANRPRRLLMARRPIRGLLLEAGNILYDDTGWRRWLLRLLTRLGLRAEYGPFFSIFDHDFLDDVYCGRRTFGEALDAFLLSAGLTKGQSEEVCRALDSHRRRSEAEYRPLIGVRETIAQLHATGVTLGVLCNCEHTGDVIRQRLAALLGDAPWAAVVSSRDLGCSMPAGDCYLAALSAVKLPAADVAFVGRDAGELHGAKRLGLSTVAFNAEPDVRAEVHLQCFEELIDLTRFSPRRLDAA